MSKSDVNVEAGSGKSDVRTRNWSFVFYPESCPENWKEVLTEHKVPMFISPLHKDDVNPDGELKKAHYHAVIMFDGPKNKKFADEISASVNGVSAESVKSIRGMARYLCHMDNPEKAQYSQDDVTCLFGADYLTAISLPTDRYQVIDEILAFCDEYRIELFADVVRYSRENRQDWFRVLCDSGAYIVKEYLKSASYGYRRPHDE